MVAEVGRLEEREQERVEEQEGAPRLDRLEQHTLKKWKWSQGHMRGALGGREGVTTRHVLVRH